MPRHLLAIVLFALLPQPTRAAGLSPWKFGMSKSEVSSFKDFGPYKEFPNGDLETFNGRFHGRKENVQFFFVNGRLQRIGVYLFEGKDSKKGGIAAAKSLQDFAKGLRKVETAELNLPPSGPLTHKCYDRCRLSLMLMLLANTHRPVKMPPHMRV